MYHGSWVRGLHITDTVIIALAKAGFMELCFDLMCILKGNSRRINFKLTSSSPSKCLGVTDVHDKAKLGRTFKRRPKQGRNHHMFPHAPSSLSYPSGHSQAQQTQLTRPSKKLTTSENMAKKKITSSHELLTKTIVSSKIIRGRQLWCVEHLKV